MKYLLKAIALAGLLMATGAQAADLGGYKDVEVADTWWQAGDIFVRVRGEAFIPETSTNSWSGNVAPLNPDAHVDTTAIPELDLSYFLTKNVAFEAICCVGETQINSAAGIRALGEVGTAWFFPPTLLIQYHWDFSSWGCCQFKPYLGIGGNYTWFFNEDASHGSVGRFRNLKLDSAGGVALQAGFDYHLTGNWFLNFDFKQLFLATEAHVTSDYLPASNNRVGVNVTLDPILVGAGIGYRFGTAPAPLK